MVDYSIKCKKLLDSYFNWQIKSIKVDSDKNKCSFITPFVDPINDNIVLSVEYFPSPDTLKISDNARTINMLYHSGVNLGYYTNQNSNTVKIFKSLLKKNKLSLEENNSISIICKIDNFPLFFNRMIETIISSFQLINFAKKVPLEKSFKELLKDYLIDNERENFKMDFKVQSKIEMFNIDFAFSNGKYKFIDTLVPVRESTKILRMQAEAQAYKWITLKEDKTYDFTSIGIYDDRKIQWPEISISILKNYSDYVLPWENRNKLLEIII